MRNRAKFKLQWVAENHLRATIWVMLSSGLEILERGAQAVLDGRELRLIAGLRTVQTSDESAACMFPVHMTFDVRGLPKGEYHVTLDASR